MLSTTRSSTRLLVARRYARCLATEAVSSSNDPAPPPPHAPRTQPKRTRLSPAPRPAQSYRHDVQPFLNLPPGFARNQLLSVSDSRRALLESIVAEFDAPIRYAFAYGSGVFEQDGYTKEDTGKEPMLDFVLAVTHPSHWHSINMNQHPGHYPMHARWLGSDFVSRVQDVSPGLWFNAFVPMKGVTIKYGVTSVDNMCKDLLNWNTLYLAGRMHKPIRIIKDDARVRLTQQVNLASAARAALLTLPERFDEKALFEAIAGISYAGDPRMMLPAENRSKVANIVSRQSPQFHELYHRLIMGMPGVHWQAGSSSIEQDVSASAKAAHLRKLPSALLGRVKAQFARNPETEESSSVYWQKLAGDARLTEIISHELRNTVRGPATVQSLKGVVSSGPTQSARYVAEKVGKWWKGRQQAQQ